MEDLMEKFKVTINGNGTNILFEELEEGDVFKIEKDSNLVMIKLADCDKFNVFSFADKYNPECGLMNFKKKTPNDGDLMVVKYNNCEMILN